MLDSKFSVELQEVSIKFEPLSIQASLLFIFWMYFKSFQFHRDA